MQFTKLHRTAGGKSSIGWPNERPGRARPFCRSRSLHCSKLAKSCAGSNHWASPLNDQVHQGVVLATVQAQHRRVRTMKSLGSGWRTGTGQMLRRAITRSAWRFATATDVRHWCAWCVTTRGNVLFVDALFNKSSPKPPPRVSDFWAVVTLATLVLFLFSPAGSFVDVIVPGFGFQRYF